MKKVVSILLFLTLVIGQNQITGLVTDSNCRRKYCIRKWNGIGQ